MRYFFGLLVLLSFAAHGQVAVDAAKLTWTNATQLVDGQPLPATGPLSVVQTWVQRSVASTCAAGAFGTVAQVLKVPVADTSALFEGLTPVGRHCFRLAHVQENGGLSAWTPAVSKVIAAPVPKAKPPTVTIS